jgi:hypothetical protein
MSREHGANRKSWQITPEEKATIQRRDLADEVPVSDHCKE